MGKFGVQHGELADQSGGEPREVLKKDVAEASSWDIQHILVQLQAVNGVIEDRSKLEMKKRSNGIPLEFPGFLSMKG